MRCQLRERLAEAKKAPRRKSLVKGTSQGVDCDIWPTLSQGSLVKGTSQGVDLAGVKD